MSLACCHGDWDDELKFVHWTYPRARKTYECMECRRPINPGDEYAKQVWADESLGFTTRRYCETCKTYCDALSELGFCWDDGGLIAAMRIYWEDRALIEFDDDKGDFVLSNGRTLNEQCAAVFGPQQKLPLE